ncbi:hypothetical protein ACIA98_28105 [Streptomyces sp. NPDC051366]|uniref:hypothetical protein n=1 Tax=Streptomyces sp. NPDC051366 TaxID=3365652 RepID=UPI003796E170
MTDRLAGERRGWYSGRLNSSDLLGAITGIDFGVPPFTAFVFTEFVNGTGWSSST